MPSCKGRSASTWQTLKHSHRSGRLGGFIICERCLSSQSRLRPMRTSSHDMLQSTRVGCTCIQTCFFLVWQQQGLERLRICSAAGHFQTLHAAKLRKVSSIQCYMQYLSCNMCIHYDCMLSICRPSITPCQVQPRNALYVMKAISTRCVCSSNHGCAAVTWVLHH